MQFAEIRFPVDISYGSSGGPAYSTDVVTMASGHELRNANWSHARARYNVAHGVKTQAQLDVLLAFFRARKGRAYGFRFKDWTDYQAQNQFIGYGDGSTTEFALVKRYVSGDSEAVRRIFKPVAGSARIYVDSAEQTSGVSVNAETGKVLFAAAPPEGAEIRADYEFDVPVRFDTDSLSARLEQYGAFSWAEIPLVELRLQD